jgi:hypothetical protein
MIFLAFITIFIVSYLWWDFLQKENDLTMIKFGNINTATSGRPPTWLAEWWEAFGVNKSVVDLKLICSMSTLPLHRVQNLYQYGPNDGEILCNFILNHHQWVNKTRTSIQMMNGQPAHSIRAKPHFDPGMITDLSLCYMFH